MSQFIHVGFGNIVNTDKIIAVVSPESAPVRRLVQRAKEEGTAVDATQGRKTKAVLVMEDNRIILSALLPETIAQRAQNFQTAAAAEREEEEHERE
ncbi:MAG: DUF370 domain-containing protein [Eubacteriales bacterium]|nr:DUF370 domain-containing protein [Eubacteriales bacterium]